MSNASIIIEIHMKYIDTGIVNSVFILNTNYFALSLKVDGPFITRVTMPDNRCLNTDGLGRNNRY